MSGVTIRPAAAADGPALTRVAALDSARVPSGDLLVAEVDGELWAALALNGGTVIADPFRPTADVVTLLERRAAQLGGVPARSRLAAVPRAVRSARARARPATSASA